MLPPLTFDEYLKFVGKGDFVKYAPVSPLDTWPVCNDIAQLNTEFVIYIKYGGYPEEVFFELVRIDAARYVKSDIIEKVLLRDLPKFYGTTNIQELNSFFTALAYQTGQEISLESLSSNSGGTTKPNINKYIERLEAAL